MTLRIQRFVNGTWRQNCYVVANDAAEAVIIDPGSALDEIVGIVRESDCRPLAILNTHAHYDHIGAVDGLMNHFGIPFYMNGADLDLLRRANLYKLIFDSRESVKVPEVTHDLRSLLPILNIGSFRIRWMATPGHTPGSTCFQIGHHLFTGDTLMGNGAGRTDLPGGNPTEIDASLRMLAALPPDTEMHAGHGRPTTLAAGLAKTQVKGELTA